MIYSTTRSERLRRCTAGLLIVASLTAFGGCALGPNPRDPFEPFNRNMMQFNEGVDAVALKPAATIYREVVPPLVRTGVRNFFGNLSDAWSAVNSLLQFRFHDAADNFARFQLNTLVGMGGIFDVASEFQVERHTEDFGQTLGRWGVPPGPYLMLPLLGPSTLRDAFALPVDRKGDLLQDIHWGAQGSLNILRVIDIRSNLLRASSVLDEAALDKYTFTRDAHLQRRRAQVFDRDNSSDSTAGQEPRADGEAAPLPGPRRPAPPAAPRAPAPATR